MELNPIALLTSYNRGERIPTQKMVIKSCSMSDKVFITSNPVASEKPKRKDRDFEKFLLTFRQKINEVRYMNGIIRRNINIVDRDSTWDVSLFDNAIQPKPS